MAGATAAVSAWDKEVWLRREFFYLFFAVYLLYTLLA